MEPNSAESPWMRVSEAVRISLTSRRTVYRLIDDGTLTAVRFGKTTLIDRASFLAAFEPVTGS